MLMRVVALALSLALVALPAKAGEFITYTAFAKGSAMFFDHTIPDPPVYKQTGYSFTFIVPLGPDYDPTKASVDGNFLTLSEQGFFSSFSAGLCLAPSANGQLPTTSSQLLGCGGVFTYTGKTSGYQFSGDVYEAFAELSDGTPQRTGFVGASFFDLPAPPAVPEPATWLMMIAGIGAVGASMRRARIVQGYPQN